MPVEIDVPFGGLNSLNASERISYELALDASDCILDNGVIQGRNGYLKATSAAIGSGTVQLLKRFRPGSTARTVFVRGGEIYTVTDPTSESASDGSAAVLAGGPYFADGDLISGVQLGAYFYIASNNSTKKWYRITPSYTLEAITPLPKGVTPTYGLSSLAWIKVTSLSAPTVIATGIQTLDYTDYHKLEAPAAGDGMYYTLAAAVDWTGYNWIAFAMSPQTQSQGGGTISISVATVSGTYEKIGEISDSPGDDTPSLVFCDLNAISTTTRAAIKKIQFTSNQAGFFRVHGWLPIPTAPGAGPQTYSVTFYDTATLQESIPTDDLLVVNNSGTIVIPLYHSVRMRGSSWYDEGDVSADPEIVPYPRCYNKGAGLALPSRYDFFTIPTFSGNIPTGDQHPLANTVRLWRITSTGKRLVKSLTYGTAVTTYQMTDDTGASTLSHQLYVPGGTPLPCASLAASGNRLISAGDPDYPNRFAVSSFEAFTLASDAYPQFPTVNTIDAEGWQADIAPSKAEQITVNLDGDKSTYLLTNYACYVMPNQTPNSPNYKIFQRGALGRQAAIWVEGALFWASTDGIYMATNRAYQDELSVGIRSIYSTWLVPTSAVVLGYQNRHLFVFQGTKYLRYDFVSKTWTRGTIAHTIKACAFWSDPLLSIQHLWLLTSDGKIMRWQESALTDDGAAIASWTYSTGFLVNGAKKFGRWVYMDVTGSTTFYIYKDTTTSYGTTRTSVATGEQQIAIAPLPTGRKWRIVLAGANTTTVNRVQVLFEDTDATGG